MGCGIFAYKFTARHCTRCCKGARSSDMITQGPVLRALLASTGGARDAHTNKWPDPLSGVSRGNVNKMALIFLASQSYEAFGVADRVQARFALVNTPP